MAREIVLRCQRWFKRHLLNRRNFNSTKFTNINTDCLEKILEKLSLSDLLNVADTNTQLKRTAERIFYRKYQPIDVTFDYCFTYVFIERGLNSDRVFSYRKVLQFFRCFGHLVQKLTINSYHLDLVCVHRARLCTYYKYFEKYCSETVSEIKLHQDLSVFNMLFSFKNVEKVSFATHGQPLGLSKYNKWFPNMRELAFKGFSVSEYAHFPHLEVCKVDFGNYCGTSITEFIQLNPQLRRIHFDCSYESFSHNTQIRTIRNALHRLPQLEFLHVGLNGLNSEDVSTIAHHDQLKVFSLRIYGNHRVDKFPFSFDRLEEFVLELDCNLNAQSIDFISEHPSIQRLSINGLGEWPLIRISKMLPSLKEMNLTNSGIGVTDAVRFVNETQSLNIFTFVLQDGSELNRINLEQELTREWTIAFIGYAMHVNSPTVRIKRKIRNMNCILWKNEKQNPFTESTFFLLQLLFLMLVKIAHFLCTFCNGIQIKI